MIPFDELHPPPSAAEHKEGLSFSSDITATAHFPLAINTPNSSSSSAIHDPEKPTTKRRPRHWLLSASYWGPFSKGDHWPLFTYLMAIFMAIIFSGEILLSKQSSGEFFELEPFNYMLGPSMEIMIQVGARFAPCMRHVDSMPPDELVNLADPRLLNSSCSLSSICGMTTFHQNQVPDQTYRLLTPLFIHTGLIHLLINLAVLVILGAKVERIINSLRFSLLYIGSGVFGHALGANFAPPTTPFLGCSSSLFGLFGFLYVDLLHSWRHLEQPIRYLIKLLLGTALSFILGLLPGVDNFSHMGGLLAGVILSLFLWPPIQMDVRNESNKKKLVLFYLARLLCLCLYGLLLGILVHHFTTSKIDEECPYCRYLSCLPINGFCD
ncbi:hypothetical protein V8B55DRAFT_1323600 [Mucor lusitanicus]|uniref:Peptidase S54 rhomboid domain-containing protein n=1 Tax=Mucor circinelloides f. lusitanicus TaxID=29924 RepID=A0A8H4BQR9_MUCCL|nr:hypothetical protein FB192DRAFT_1316287 [Mucor lusitanicus]